MSVTVARVHPEDWQELKTVRLAALRDAPYAFATRYENVVDRPDDYWRETAMRGGTSANNAIFLARDTQGNGIGMAGGFREPDTPDIVHLIAVWVRPEWRGQGVAGPLIEAVCAWAAQLPVPALHAYVTEGNDRALRFYEKQGFVVQPPDALRPGAHCGPTDILILRQLHDPKEIL